MVIRIGVGLLGAALYLTAVFIQVNGWPFALGVAVFAILGASELYHAVQRQQGEPTEFIGYIACIVFQYGAWTHRGARFGTFLPAVLILLLIAALLSELVKRRPHPLVNVGATLLGAVYVGWMCSYLTLLRSTSLPVGVLAPPIAGTTTAEWLVVFVTGATWLSDAGALFAGRLLGRRKLAPAISPSKTWEGSIGGIAVSVLFGLALGHWVHLPLVHSLTLALICCIAGQVGDLCESALKRDLGLKDFGDWIPGHGGVLDRIDSLLFSAPLAYYYVVYFLR
ncbi:MAG: phosphatidate cytidylyltransferase [Capsulimonadaceae bacterium]